MKILRVDLSDKNKNVVEHFVGEFENERIAYLIAEMLNLHSVDKNQFYNVVEVENV